jgi:hypothetical protein
MDFSKKTKLGVLLENEEAKAVLVKYFTKDFLTHPMIAMAKGFSLEKVAELSGGQMTDEFLDAADVDLQAL